MTIQAKTKVWIIIRESKNRAEWPEQRCDMEEDEWWFKEEMRLWRNSDKHSVQSRTLNSVSHHCHLQSPLFSFCCPPPPTHSASQDFYTTQTLKCRTLIGITVTTFPAIKVALNECHGCDSVSMSYVFSGGDFLRVSADWQEGEHNVMQPWYENIQLRFSDITTKETKVHRGKWALLEKQWLSFSYDTLWEIFTKLTIQFKSAKSWILITSWE